MDLFDLDDGELMDPYDLMTELSARFEPVEPDEDGA